MIIISKVISTALGPLGRRLTKILRSGKSDVQTAIEAAPYGTDANPIAGMQAVYAPSSNKSKKVIIGYLNKNQVAAVGEHRSYSTDEEGNLKFFVWIKNDGTLQLGGSVKHIANYEGLETAFNALKDDFNNFITAYNSHTHAGVTAGASVTAITTPGTPSTADITPAKNDKIKTI